MPQFGAHGVLRTPAMQRHLTTIGTLAALLALGLLSGCADSLMFRGASPEAAEAPPDYQGEDPLADDDDDAAGDDDDDTGGGGNEVAELLNIDPAPGSDDHHYRRPIVISFTESATGTSFALFEGAAPVALDVSWDDDATTCTLTPDRLAPNTTYTMEVDLYGQGQAWTFTTSGVGELEVDPSTLDQATFVLDIESASLLSPPGLGALSANATQNGAPAVQVEFASSGTERFTLQAGLVADADGDWSQDPCASAQGIAIDEDFQRSDAFFSAAGDSMSFYLGSALVQTEEAWVEGDFSADGESLVEVDVGGWVVADSLDELSSGMDVCATLADTLGTPCVQCPTSDGQCAWFEIEGISGTRVNLDIEDIQDGTCTDGDETVWLGCSTVARHGATPLLLLLGLLAMAVRRRIG